MGNNYFLMKAHTYNPAKHFSRSDFYSTKLDGMRCLWDGGVTRGRKDVPWAKGDEATGLWSMNGKIIYAPSFFLDDLPKAVIDSELWAGIGRFQQVMRVCKSHKADDRWQEIQMRAYDMPSPSRVFQPRVIDEKHCKINISMATSQYFQRLYEEAGMRWYIREGWTPDQLDALATNTMMPHQHFLLAGWTPEERASRLDGLLNDLVAEGHEGVMLRRLGSFWTPVRSHDLVKLKPFIDDEAIVIGIKLGQDSDLGGKYLGMVGSLICKWGDKIIKVSGLSDDLRGLRWTKRVKPPTGFDSPQQWAVANPGLEMIHDNSFVVPDSFGPHTTITFRYREKTEDGMPKDPRFHRVREEE